MLLSRRLDHVCFSQPTKEIKGRGKKISDITHSSRHKLLKVNTHTQQAHRETPHRAEGDSGAEGPFSYGVLGICSALVVFCYRCPCPNFELAILNKEELLGLQLQTNMYYNSMGQVLSLNLRFGWSLRQTKRS